MIHFKRVPTHVSPMNTLKQKLGLSLQVAKGHVTHPHIFFFFFLPYGIGAAACVAEPCNRSDGTLSGAAV